MHSIRTKITVLTLIAILISLLSFGVTGVYSTMIETNRTSAQTLNLICENRKDVLNEYLNSIRQSVNMISRYSSDSLDSLALVEGGVIGAEGKTLAEFPGRTDRQRETMDRYFDRHLAAVEGAFASVANHTNGIAGYYYRINPEFTTDEKGFFYTRSGNGGFQSTDLTPIQKYDPEDAGRFGWYYIPLKQGRPSWMEPYYNENIKDQVLSYIVPIYKAGTFIGVLGMDIRYDTLVSQIEQLSLYETGYFVLTDKDGYIIYHPDVKSGTRITEAFPQLSGMAEEIQKDSEAAQLTSYKKDGTRWELTYTTLANDLNLVAVVKSSEINANWHRLTKIFIVAGLLILIAFMFITTLVMKHVTDPLERLTMASRRLAAGDYDVEIDYNEEDEVGVLSRAFLYMRDRLKIHIDDLNSKVYRDALTGVKNKAAYDAGAETLDLAIREPAQGRMPEFAIVVMDCDGLKHINDVYGHDKGDIYLRTACKLICHVYEHSPVFRIGGDEFLVLLEGTDFENREELFTSFDQRKARINAEAADPWDKIHISKGMAVYRPNVDPDVKTVFHRADKRMYDDKSENRKQKENALD